MPLSLAVHDKENLVMIDLAAIVAKITLLRGRIALLHCSLNAELVFRAILRDVELTIPLVNDGLVKTPGLLCTLGVILNATLLEPCITCHHLRVLQSAVWLARTMYDDSKSPCMQGGAFMYLAEKEITQQLVVNG